MRRLFVLAVILVVSCAPATPPPQTSAAVTVSASYAADSGEKAVGVIPSTILHDSKRNKDLEVSVDYPIHGLSYPVIVFSHGYGGSSRTYESLASFWTSYGYVVIRPSHADANVLRDLYEQQSRMSGPAGQRRDERRERNQPREEPAATETARAFVKNAEEMWEKEREPQWRDRAADISFVIDSLDELEQRFPELRGKIDHARIGVGGHSYGAFTAMLIAGMRPSSNPPLAVADPRVKAAMAMSPQGVSDARELTAQSWANVKIPMLYMTGSNDRGALQSEDADWRRTAFVNSPPGDKYFVEIEGARHLSFTGRVSDLAEAFAARDERPRTTTSPRGTNPVDTSPARRAGSASFLAERQIFANIRQISLAFWDAFLKNDAKGRDYLDKGLEAAKSASVKVEKK